MATGHVTPLTQQRFWVFDDKNDHVTEAAWLPDQRSLLFAGATVPPGGGNFDYNADPAAAAGVVAVISEVFRVFQARFRTSRIPPGYPVEWRNETLYSPSRSAA
jgi:hypothetical protein